MRPLGQMGSPDFGHRVPRRTLEVERAYVVSESFTIRLIASPRTHIHFNKDNWFSIVSLDGDLAVITTNFSNGGVYTIPAKELLANSDCFS